MNQILWAKYFQNEFVFSPKIDFLIGIHIFHIEILKDGFMKGFVSFYGLAKKWIYGFASAMTDIGEASEDCVQNICHRDCFIQIIILRNEIHLTNLSTRLLVLNPCNPLTKPFLIGFWRIFFSQIRPRTKLWQISLKKWLTDPFIVQNRFILAIEKGFKIY